MGEQCMCPVEAGAATCELVISSASGVCRDCEQKGKVVDLNTLKALLAVPLTELKTTEYAFCRTPDCPTVYYSVDGQQRYEEDTLRERVHQKHLTADDVFVCYCFRHSSGSIRAELASTGRSSVVASVAAGIQAGQCACDVRNPQGSCCLGNVRAAVQRLEAESLRGEKRGGEK